MLQRRFVYTYDWQQYYEWRSTDPTHTWSTLTLSLWSTQAATPLTGSALTNPDMIDTDNHIDNWRSTDPSTHIICKAMYLCIYVVLCSAFYTHRHDVQSNTDMTYTGSDIHCPLAAHWPTDRHDLHWQRQSLTKPPTWSTLTTEPLTGGLLTHPLTRSSQQTDRQSDTHT